MTKFAYCIRLYVKTADLTTAFHIVRTATIRKLACYSYGSIGYYKQSERPSTPFRCAKYKAGNESREGSCSEWGRINYTQDSVGAGREDGTFCFVFDASDRDQAQ